MDAWGGAGSLRSCQPTDGMPSIEASVSPLLLSADLTVQIKRSKQTCDEDPGT
ncbi:hypothetical protein COCNU_scaffold036828G000030 [Cocos nucifera]|nr:hypothetical protein [Cocos nucifera]